MTARRTISILVVNLLMAAWFEAAAADLATPRPVTPAIDLARKTVKIDAGIVLPFSTTWAPSAITYDNAVELVARGGTGLAARVDARTIITVERRLSHAEAVQRLSEIATAHPGSVNYLSIGGWPAVQLRYTEPLPQAEERRGEVGEAERETKDVDRDDERRLATHTTTAIASGDRLIRMDTTVDPGANPKRVKEAEDLARKMVLPARPSLKDTILELQRLRTPGKPVRGAITIAPVASSQATVNRVQPTLWGTGSPNAAVVSGADSETSAGVSNTGLNMIVATNAGSATISTDGGATFVATTATLPFGNRGDPSVTIGRSGNFYIARLGRPVDATGALQGCSASVMSSGNNGAVFDFTGHAALCPATGTGICTPDQEHIAADRSNRAPRGGDQLYAVWRNFTPSGTVPALCSGIQTGSTVSTMSCSVDSGSNWLTQQIVGPGDFARLTVGSDGFVYVVTRDGNNVMLHKYNSCSSGLVELTGFPRRVLDGIVEPKCPLPGIDRCGWGLIVPTVAIDDRNPSHVYIAVTKPGGDSSPNDDILVIDSADGGLTWGIPVVVNQNVSARRFMPWICSSVGNAYVGWYDRRAVTATSASNDLTDYFLGAVTTRGGRLVADGESNLTGTSDAQCASGWPVPPRASADATSCSTSQLAGSCRSATGGGTGQRCDFNAPACPAGETCQTDIGRPKYGDYNGIACGRDRVLATWASATAPLGFSGTIPAGIQVFADVKRVIGKLSIVERTIPPTDLGRFDILVDNVVVAASVANSTAGPLDVDVLTPHVVSQSAAPGYVTTVDGDCEADGTVHFSALHPAKCRISNLSRKYDACLKACGAAEALCMAGAHSGPERAACVGEKNACIADCSSASITVVKSLQPAVDNGRFDLRIDGIVHAAGVGDGGRTPEVGLLPGSHVVSESATGGASSTNYSTTIGGSCQPDGRVTLHPGDNLLCTVSSTRLPGTGADGTIAVNSVLSPPTDAGRFDLRIDGVTRAARLGDAGSTGAITVFEGVHKIDEIGNTTDLSKYVRTIGGDCDSSGRVIVLPGQSKTCTITNRRDNSRCTNACSVAEGVCMRDAHTSGERRECISEKNDCVAACRAD